MKKIFFLLGVVALAVAGFSMFKVLTSNDHGKENAQNDSETSGSAIEETREERTEETREGSDS